MARRKTNPTRARTKIARLRLKHGITQAALAEASGVKLRQIRDIERGTEHNDDGPRVHDLVRIASAFGVPLEDVIEDKWLTPTYLEFDRSGTVSRWVEKPVQRLKGPDGKPLATGRSRARPALRS